MTADTGRPIKGAPRLPFFNDTLASGGASCEGRGLSRAGVCVVSVTPFQSLIVLALGFAMAGVFANGYQLVTARPASFDIFGEGSPRPSALASIPFLVFAAPLIIMRNTIHACRQEQRNFMFAMFATIIAGFWSLMSGSVFVMALEALGFLAA